MKPCPFCSHESIEIVKVDFVDRVVAECEACHARGVPAVTESAAIDLWNSRPLEVQKSLQLQLEDLALKIVVKHGKAAKGTHDDGTHNSVAYCKYKLAQDFRVLQSAIAVAKGME